MASNGAVFKMNPTFVPIIKSYCPSVGIRDWQKDDPEDVRPKESSDKEDLMVWLQR